MIASLYQSASSVVGFRSSTKAASISGFSCPDPPYSEGQMGRVQPDRLPLSGALEILAADKVLECQRAHIAEAELPERKLDAALLDCVRVESDGDQEHIMTLGICLLEEHDVA